MPAEFDADGKLVTPTSEALDAVSKFRRDDGLPTDDPVREALEQVSKVDRDTGLPK